MVNMRSRVLITMAFGVALSRGQDGTPQYLIEHPECTLFGPKRDAFLAAGKETYRLSALTNLVVGRLARANSAVIGRESVTGSDARAASSNLIDRNLFQAM